MQPIGASFFLPKAFYMGSTDFFSNRFEKWVKWYNKQSRYLVLDERPFFILIDKSKFSIRNQKFGNCIKTHSGGPTEKNLGIGSPWFFSFFVFFSQVRNMDKKIKIPNCLILKTPLGSTLFQINSQYEKWVKWCTKQST